MTTMGFYEARTHLSELLNQKVVIRLAVISLSSPASRLRVGSWRGLPRQSWAVRPQRAPARGRAGTGAKPGAEAKATKAPSDSGSKSRAPWPGFRCRWKRRAPSAAEGSTPLDQLEDGGVIEDGVAHPGLLGIAPAEG